MNLDFLTIDVGTILFTLINTLLIFLAFKFILFKRVDAVLAKRQDEVKATYTAADDALAAANSDKEKYEQAIAGARDEAAVIINRAEKKAQKEARRAEKQAEKEARRKAKLDEKFKTRTADPLKASDIDMVPEDDD